MTTLRLFRIHLVHHSRSLFVLATIVLVMSTLTALLPRATNHLLTDALRDQVDSLTVNQRDLSAHEQGTPTPTAAADPAANDLPSASDPVWGGLDDTMREIRAEMPPLLRSLFGPGQFAMTLPTAPASPADPTVRTKANAVLSIGFDPFLADHVRITKGRAPAEVTADLPAAGHPVDIVLSDAAAKTMHWPVGQLRVTRGSGGPPIETRLSGTYAPKDRADPVWAQVPGTLVPSVFEPDGGKPIVTAVGWAEPGSLPQLVQLSSNAILSAWFPLDSSALTSGNAQAYAGQLREFVRRSHLLPGDGYLNDAEGEPTIVGATELAFTSDVPRAIDEANAASTSALAMIALFASGPLGVAAIVLMLAAGLALRQQRRSLALVAARGMSASQLRTLVGVEGLAAGVPMALVGAVIGAVILPHDGSAAAGWWPALVGITPGLLMALSPPVSARAERADLTSSGAGSQRWILDVLVLLGAAAAIVALHGRGLATPDGGVDPLLAATPLLLSLAACLVVMRAYPWVLNRLLARTARWRGPTALIGTARALRDPAAGLAAALALVTSVGIAVFSAVATTTLQHGVVDASREAVGADLVVDGRPLNPRILTTLSERADVRATAGITEQTGVPLFADNKPVFARVLFVDVAALRRVQKDVPGAVRLPPALEETSGDRASILVSKGFAKDDADLRLGDTPVDVVGTASVPSPLTTLSSWVLIDRSVAKRLGLDPGPPGRLLVSTAGPASAARDAVRALPGDAQAETPQDLANRLEYSPLVPGVRHAAQIALGTLLALCLSVIALTLVRGEASRSRQAALLDAMGEPRRRSRWLVAWEVGPLAVLAITSGVLFGLLLPRIVLAAIDLRAFTTGTVQPPVHLDPVPTILIAAGVLVAVAAGTFLAAAATRRQELSRLLRMTED
ncbi:FtsX-like permease family protein [Aeromicrobium ginsengisoli]|uniref:FtsX-like permease family protein n=1 Tax=Aeromicrobium ginsengisoli TaxID=363867 RepID=A0A5M4FBE2_9ACTN|nr:FtsX-like permease family protein [Aeromicrobium ginsengisoli]KAA1395567.1 FtsX-like permease family protein [Aeromicrobium ginsengisoli]